MHILKYYFYIIVPADLHELVSLCGQYWLKLVDNLSLGMTRKAFVSAA